MFPGLLAILGYVAGSLVHGKKEEQPHNIPCPDPFAHTYHVHSAFSCSRSVNSSAIDDFGSCLRKWIKEMLHQPSTRNLRSSTLNPKQGLHQYVAPLGPDAGGFKLSKDLGCPHSVSIV